MKCYDCNNESTHFVAWDDGMFELCAECYDFAMAESVANNALPKLMGAARGYGHPESEVLGCSCCSGRCGRCKSLIGGDYA